MLRPCARCVIAAVVLGVAASTAAPALAKQCKSYFVTGDAMKATVVAIAAESVAKTFAREHWVKACMARAGNPWCDHQIWSDAKWSCNKVPSGAGLVSPLVAYNWTCTVRAIPCRN
jgi:hypothetical protein